MFQDYCLVCDKQCASGALYCSNKCEQKELSLANAHICPELEQSHTFSPLYSTPQNSRISSDASSIMSSSGIYSSPQLSSSFESIYSKSLSSSQSSEGSFLLSTQFLHISTPESSPKCNNIPISIDFTKTQHTSDIQIQSVDNYKKWLNVVL